MPLPGKGPTHLLERGDKALQIHAVIEDHLKVAPHGKRILDIGCGNGDISILFAKNNEQHGVDIEDKRRTENDSFTFQQVKDELLPYPDQYFDIVISNHVVEHVIDQRLHLSEIHRVLAQNGICYMATPNKSSPIMEGHAGNDLVLRYRQMRPFFEVAGFRVDEYSTKFLAYPKKYRNNYRLSFVPFRILFMLRRWFQSHIFILTKN